MDDNINSELTPEEIMELIKQFNNYLTLKGRPCQSLKRQLDRIPANELRLLAMDYHIALNNHKKAELISLLAEVMVDHDVIKQTLLEMPRETRNFLFEVANERNGRYESEFESPDLFFKAVQRGLMGIYKDKDCLIFAVTKEVREALENVMNDEAFCEKLFQYESLEITLRASINLYGIVKRNDIIDTYKYYFPDQTFSMTIKGVLNFFIDNRDWLCVKGDYLCFPIFEDVPENVIEENYAFAKSHGRYYPVFEDFIRFFYFDFEEDSEERQALYYTLRATIGDEDVAEEIISAAISIFRSGGVVDDFDEMLMEEWAEFIDADEFEAISEAGEAFGATVHAWVFCGHSYNEISGIATRPSLSVIKGDKETEAQEDSKIGTNQKDHSEQQSGNGKPTLRLL